MPGGPCVSSGAGFATARQWLSSYRMSSASAMTALTKVRSTKGRLQPSSFRAAYFAPRTRPGSGVLRPGQGRLPLVDLLLQAVDRLPEHLVDEGLPVLAGLLLRGLRLGPGAVYVAV